MIIKDKRLLGTIAGAMALAAVAGFGLARCTADPTSAAAAEAEAEADDEKAPDNLAITPEAIKMAEIGVEIVGAGGLNSEIIAQATVTASPSGEAAITARAGGAVTRVFKQLGDPVRAGETLAIVQSRDAAQMAAERTAADARSQLAQKISTARNLCSISGYRPGSIMSGRRPRRLQRPPRHSAHALRRARPRSRTTAEASSSRARYRAGSPPKASVSGPLFSPRPSCFA